MKNSKTFLRLYLGGMTAVTAWAAYNIKEMNIEHFLSLKKPWLHDVQKLLHEDNTKKSKPKM